ncbi:hypothetical protein, partial [Streptomyces sp. NPDC048256]|uniref:hypothetical protein n=2 Tax=unclassified Streptomyces TaxID=2593676 RepID=UPI0033D5FFE6
AEGYDPLQKLMALFEGATTKSLKAGKAEELAALPLDERQKRRIIDGAGLLRPERIGVRLSEEFQLHPEQSTDAIVVHHPEASYFNAGGRP